MDHGGVWIEVCDLRLLVLQGGEDLVVEVALLAGEGGFGVSEPVLGAGVIGRGLWIVPPLARRSRENWQPDRRDSPRHRARSRERARRKGLTLPGQTGQHRPQPFLHCMVFLMTEPPASSLEFPS